MKEKKEQEKLKPQTAKVAALQSIIKQQSILNSVNLVSSLVEKQKK